jgi:hypothetical protein
VRTEGIFSAMRSTESNHALGINSFGGGRSDARASFNEHTTYCLTFIVSSLVYTFLAAVMTQRAIVVRFAGLPVFTPGGNGGGLGLSTASRKEGEGD